MPLIRYHTLSNENSFVGATDSGLDEALSANQRKHTELLAIF